MAKDLNHEISRQDSALNDLKSEVDHLKKTNKLVAEKLQVTGHQLLALRDKAVICKSDIESNVEDQKTINTLVCQFIKAASFIEHKTKHLQAHRQLLPEGAIQEPEKFIEFLKKALGILSRRAEQFKSFAE